MLPPQDSALTPGKMRRKEFLLGTALQVEAAPQQPAASEHTKRKEFIPVLQVSFLIGEGVWKIPEEILFKVAKKV